MSRLIDADALMADLEKWLKQIDPTHPPEDNSIPPMEDIIVSTLMTIEEQPTIEPQRMRGRWIEPTEDNDYWECSVCHDTYELDVDVTPQDARMFFCSNCGAWMGEQNE